MHINDDHMYHGAALTQIADRPEFKAINAFKQIKARGAFRINDDIGIYIKHAAKPTNTKHREYLFAFSASNRSDIETMNTLCKKVFIVLVCVKVKEICVLEDSYYDELMEARSEDYLDKYNKEEKYPTILVTARSGEQFRVYVNQAKKKDKLLAKKVIKRSAFPAVLF